MQVPDGIDELDGPPAVHAVRLHPVMVGSMWVGAVLMVLLGAFMFFAALSGPVSGPDAGNPDAPGGVPIGAPILFGLCALFVLYAAIRSHRPKYLIDDQGAHAAGLFGRTTVRWAEMERVELSQPRGNALWFTAPGGILRGNRVTRKKRVSFYLTGLRVRNTDLQAFVVARAREIRSRPAPSP